MCVQGSNKQLGSIGPYNSLVSNMRQAIIWTQIGPIYLRLHVWPNLNASNSESLNFV